MEDEKIERLRERMLQCPICMDEFNDPRMLPCHHSVCLHCLMDFVQHSSSSGRVFRCPQCRMDICVPRGGVKDFPPNFYINCIQEELGSKPYYGICNICERDWLVSQYRCITCDLDICKFCIHEHKLFKHDDSRVGEIIKIETGNISPKLVSQKSCENHEGEPLQMFCLSCDRLCCVTCICESHRKHESIPLSKKLKLAQKHLQFELDNIKEKVKSVIENRTMLEKMRETMQSAKDNCIKAIRSHARDLSIEIKKIAEKKVEDVKAASEFGIRDIDLCHQEISTFADHLRKGNKFLEDLEEGDMSLELLNNFKKFQQKTDILQRTVEHRRICYQNICFKSAPMKSFLGIFRYFNFGTLSKEKVSVTIMTKKPHPKMLGPFPKYCRKLFRFQIIFFIGMWPIVIISLLYLSCNLYQNVMEINHSQHNLEGSIAGLCFFFYLALSALCAFIKS